MLKNVFFYFTEEIGTGIKELIAELDSYQVHTEQIAVTEGMETTIAEAMEESLYVTDSGNLCRFLGEKQIPVIAYFHGNGEKQDFGKVKYVVEAIEAMDYLYLKGVYQRYKGIPWEILETKRCLVREITVADVETLYELYQEPSITVYMEDLYQTMEEEKEYTELYIENIYAYYEYGMWIVVEKATGKIIGRAGLEKRDNEEDSLELGYMIAKPYQRKGFAFEVCTAIIEYADRQLGIGNIHSLIERENIPSICLSQKLGFSLTGEKYENGKDYQQYSNLQATN